METPSSDAPITDDPTKPNLARAVKLVTDRRTGETRPAKKSGRPRKGAKRPATSAADGDSGGESAREVPEITEADIKGAAFLGGVTWKIVGTFTGNRELTKDEQGELGEALAPVLAKYLPDLGVYAPEIALVLTVWGLYETTKKPRGDALSPDDAKALADPRLGAAVIHETPEELNDDAE
jgi:hypothetical protein